MPLLYVASDIDTCLFERFGDLTYDDQNAIAQSIWDLHSVSEVRIPEVPLCDLTDARTLSSAMVDLAALMHNDLAVPKAWGLAIQQHPANFQGIKFKSRFNGKACLALFKRNRIEKRLRATVLDSLPGNEPAVDWLHKYKVSLY